MRKLSWLLLLVFVSNFSVSAQNQQYTHDLKDFNKALSLFNDGQFASSQIIFEK
jgi:hypothetical protein